MFPSRKNAGRTISEEVAGHASTSRAPEPDIEADANMGPTPDVPPTEDADRLSATNSEVESAMNHMRRRAVLRDACFSQEAFDAFNSGDDGRLSHHISISIPLYILPSGRHAQPAVTRQQGAPKPGRLKRKAVRTETPPQRYDTEPRSVVVVF